MKRGRIGKDVGVTLTPQARLYYNFNKVLLQKLESKSGKIGGVKQNFILTANGGMRV